jgi:hypothetical protein
LEKEKYPMRLKKQENRVMTNRDSTIGLVESYDENADSHSGHQPRCSQFSFASNFDAKGFALISYGTASAVMD